MKIIDLFNKIANGEDAPKKIKYRDKIWEYNIKSQDYHNENDKTDILFSYLFNYVRTSDFINDEVEIIEAKEEAKKDLAFIKYLESEIGCRELISDSLFNHNKELKVYKEVLQKYKEIGDDK